MKKGDNTQLILDKLQEGKLKDAHFSKFARDLISNLKEKQQDVVVRRFGLSGRKKTTLDAIGKDFGVTRERVRQIEAASLTKLRKLSKLEHNKPFFDKIHNIIDSNGGIIHEDALISELIADLEEKRTEEIKKTLHFILLLSSEVKEIKDSEYTRSGWCMGRFSEGIFEDLSRAYAEILELKKEVTADEIILSEILKHEIVAKYKKDVTKELLQSSLEIAKKLHKADEGKRGLVTWPWVKPRTIRDKIFYILSRKGAPMHFSEIHSAIESAGFDHKKATIQTIHNELISDDRFILVGRGLYGLKDWGYESGTVEEVIAKILKNAGKPLSQNEIVEEVMKKKQIKKATVLINLQNSRKFNKTSEGYVLAGE